MWLLAVAAMLAPGISVAQTEWVDDPGEPVLGPAEPGAWDDGARYPMAVIQIDGTFHLYYNGQRSGSGQLDATDVGHATSTDGVAWEIDPANPVLTRGSAGEWDDHALWGVAIIHDDSGFRMWYSGVDMDSGVGRVGTATSSDGSTWTKHTGNPIMDVGPTGSFDDELVLPGTVILEGELYRMWYMSSRALADPNDYDWRIGYAESGDGLTWHRLPEPVLDTGPGWENWLVYAPSVLYDGSEYHMWYTGHNGFNIAIGYAVSDDGVEWTKYWRNPVVEIGGGSVGTDNARVIFDELTGVYTMWYHDLDADTLLRATSTCCSTIFPAVIPAVAYAAGAEGSFYETDIDVSNAGTTDADYRFSWMPRGETNSDAIESELFTLGAGMSVRYTNVLAEVFDLEPDAFGALAIDASSRNLLAMARIANTPQEEVAGTFGQSMPAVAIGDFIPRGERRRLLFGTEHADMRTNVGCFNASDAATRVNFELFAADGTLLGTESVVLMPWSNEQLNRIFDPYHPVTGCVDFWTDIAATQIYCYGSVLDNVTSDPTTIPPL
jgi:predicted GH43/DUF377 family glycosyl hydrolase